MNKMYKGQDAMVEARIKRNIHQINNVEMGEIASHERYGTTMQWIPDRCCPSSEEKILRIPVVPG